MKKYKTVSEYMGDLEPMQYEVAQIMRELLREAAPESSETISYNMPAIRQHQQILAYFAPTSKHLGLYPTAQPILVFKDRLKNFQTTKGTIKIPYDQPLPAKLIRDIVAYRIQQVTDEQ